MSAAPDHAPARHPAALRAAALLLLALAACGSPPGEERVFELGVSHREVAPELRLIKVGEGDTVRLRWRTDEPLTVHLHGYDVELALVPGNLTELTFVAFASGRFPVNVHGAGGDQGQPHDDRVLTYIEVYPR